MTTDPCAIYLRISLDPSGKQEAVTRQLADCERLLALKGWSLYGEPYCDNSISAFDSDKQRPAYNRMVEDYLAGRFSRIICWDLDRLTRQPRQLEDWIDHAVKRGLYLVTANGEADLSTDGGRMYARIKAAVARGEMERKSARQLYANQFRAEQGLPHTAGPRAFGYANGGVEVIEEEANALVWAASQILSGASLEGTAKALTARGFTGGSTTARRVGWVLRRGAVPAYYERAGITGPGLRYMLCNPRYVALRAHRGVVVGPGQWPAILDETTHRRLVALLRQPGRNTGGLRNGRSPVYLLSGGPVTCGQCGSTLKRGTHHGGDGYKCSNHCAFGHAAAMEAKVERAVIALLSSPEILSALTRSDNDTLSCVRDKADAIRARVAFVDEDFTRGAWDHDLAGYRKMRDAMLAEVARLDSELHAGNATQALDGLALGRAEVIQQWADLDKVRQRAVITILLDARLLPAGKARRWDVDRHLCITPRIEMSALGAIQFQQSIMHMPN